MCLFVYFKIAELFVLHVRLLSDSLKLSKLGGKQNLHFLKFLLNPEVTLCGQTGFT